MADAIATELDRFSELTKQVVDQTTRRIVHGEKVPHDEKLVSIFETHTNILVKGHREVPGDVTLTKTIVERHKEIFDRAPRQVAFDGGFASQANLAALKEMGVEDVAFSKPCGLAIHEMARSSWVFKCLRNFRTAIEGTISFLKRCFGLARGSWRTLKGFKSYVWGSVVSAKLLILARHKIAARA